MSETYDEVEAALLVVHEPVPLTPMGMIQLAISKGADIDQLTKLMDLQDRHEKNEARKAFQVAFAKFKSEAIKIARLTDIKDGPLKGKKYSDLSTAVNAITPKLSENGLSAAWKITKDEKDWMEVTCTVTHILGHSESTSMGGPPDTGGAKNAIQARASTLNYLERYSLLALTGTAASGADDDGRQATGKQMPEGEKADFLAAIEDCATEDAAAKLWATIAKATTQAGDVNAHEELRAAMTAKRKEIIKLSKDAI